MNWPVMRAIIAKDLIAVRRSKAVVIPMLVVPALLMIVLPLAIGLAARAPDTRTSAASSARCPATSPRRSSTCPTGEQLIVLVNGYLLAPLFLIVPLMVSAVLAADAFAGEKERKTLESLLHLPIAGRDLFLAKLLTAFIPAMVVSWVGFICFCIVSNVVAWPVLHRIFVPTQLWFVMILWVGAGGGRAWAGGDGARVGAGPHHPGGQPARRRGDPARSSSWPSASPRGLLLVPVARGDRHRCRHLDRWRSCLVRGGAKRFTRDQLGRARVLRSSPLGRQVRRRSSDDDYARKKSWSGGGEEDQARRMARTMVVPGLMRRSGR